MYCSYKQERGGMQEATKTLDNQLSTCFQQLRAVSSMQEKVLFKSQSDSHEGKGRTSVILPAQLLWSTKLSKQTAGGKNMLLPVMG